MASIKSIPLVGDILDLRAETRSSDQSWLGVLKIAVPAALGGVFSITDLALKLLAPVPGAAIVLWAGVPVGLVVVCVSVISLSVKEVSDGAFPHGPIKKYRYRFTNPERVTAKIALIPLILLAGYYVWSILPNRLIRQNHVAGFICRSDQAGITDGVVEVVNVAGGIVSKEPQQLDDTGFFYSDLKPWGSRPYSLRVSSGSCGAAHLMISDTAQNGAGCPHDEDQRIDRPQEYMIWTITCNR
jgi:hypothetical protein